MQEEYLLEKMIKGKTDREKEIELMQAIIETKEMLKIAISNFEYAEDDLIDYYTYQIKANQAKLDYLIKFAKRKGIVFNKVNELKTKLAKVTQLRKLSNTSRKQNNEGKNNIAV